MALTDQDRAYIHEVAVNSATEVSRQIIENILKWHIGACPHGKTLLSAKWALIGACLCSGIGGGAGAFALIKALTS